VFWISRLLLLLVADADLSTYTSSMNEAYFVDKVVVVVVVVVVVAKWWWWRKWWKWWKWWWWRWGWRSSKNGLHRGD
jgi:hypothetical protein